MRNTLGSRTIARPMATRWRWPPDMFFGLRSSRAVSDSRSAALATRWSISALGTFIIRSAKPMFWATVMCGSRA